jgi:hypothetical protein
LNQRHRATLARASDKPRYIRQAALEHALHHVQLEDCGGDLDVASPKVSDPVLSWACMASAACARLSYTGRSSG